MLRIGTIALAAIAAAALCLSSSRAAVADDAPPPGHHQHNLGAGFMALGKLALLRSDKVQKELEMTDQQSADLKKFAEETREQIGKETKGLRGSFRNLSEDERKAKLAELRSKFEERQKDIQKKLDEVLNTKQRQRLAELEFQLRGTGALFQKDVATALQITDEQKKKLDDLRSGQRGDLHKLFQAARSDREGLHEKMQKARKEADEKLLAVLTPEQHEKLEKMEGKKFEFDPEQLNLFRGGFGEHGHRGAGSGGDRSKSGAPKTDTPKTESSKTDAAS
jgi:Spy/CpxP family protein refolding chaperone